MAIGVGVLGLRTMAVWISELPIHRRSPATRCSTPALAWVDLTIWSTSVDSRRGLESRLSSTWGELSRQRT